MTVRTANPIPIVFDTSVLTPIRPSNPPAEIRLLKRLAVGGHVRLLVPEMATREWLSQLSAPATGAIGRLQKAVSDINRHDSTRNQDAWTRTGVAKTLTDDVLKALAELPHEWHVAKFYELGFRSLSLQEDDWRGVLDLYFGGEPPFGRIKSRKDIPDALVCAGALRALGDNPLTVFVCHDARLRKAIESKGGAVAKSLTDLMRSDIIAQMHSNPKFALWWEEHLNEIINNLRGNSDELREYLSDEIPSSVCSEFVHHYDIPDENNEAYVDGYGEMSDLEFAWDKSESLGEGIVSIPITFDVDLLLSFSVPRWDAFDVPDWVSVSFGDFEKTHYFDAEGCRIGQYKARLVLEYGTSAMDGNLSFTDTEFSIQDAELVDFE